MFKVSQDINLNPNASQNLNNIETTSFDISRVQITNFPSAPVCTASDVNFIIKKCGVQTTLEIIVESPLGERALVQQQILDPDNLLVRLRPMQEGIYRVYIRCNSTDLPRSPYMFVAQSPNQASPSHDVHLPVFNSDTTRVLCNGSGLQKILLNEPNEFSVDASAAGNNILFVGICGPRGQCDEVSIKHVGGNVYKVSYRVQDRGVYMIAVKWGDGHIPGSPFQLVTMQQT